MHQSQYGRNQNRLEAYLSRHWAENRSSAIAPALLYLLHPCSRAFSAFTTSVWLPEVLALFDLDSVTLEKLLITYGPPQAIAADARQAAKNMQAWGGHFLKDGKMACVIASALHTIGQPCIEAVYALWVSAATCKPWRPECSTAVAKAKRPNRCWRPVPWPMPG